jgi:hypothetical protein
MQIKKKREEEVFQWDKLMLLFRTERQSVAYYIAWENEVKREGPRQHCGVLLEWSPALSSAMSLR